MRPVPEFPTTPTALLTADHVRARVTEPVANHSFRSYLFAMLFAEHEGVRPGTDFDPELLFHACALHDLGTSAEAEGVQRFEVEGADMAAALLTGHGVDAAGVDLVWEAIALHSSPGIAERRGPLAHLARRGITADFGRDSEFVTDAQGREIHTRLPRLRMAASLVEGIARHAERGGPRTAPPYSLPGELLRERGADRRPTGLELGAAAARWGA
ncbi:HD domain-containing protein [Streptomyces sp. NRRL B-24484]|uniref:HD domain-containing protein n=1 Tax=Streptomyces sp. NRRL B-24484 TaxID=1463833 RepID=UPI0004BF6D81|nr:HD domain-containing protein [Streptomyces sp. NRRL B-24484]